MRNLKRALSLALASVMLLGMMVVGTGAASYPDVSSSDNEEAIAVAQAAGIMVGDDNGNFNPDKNVTRNEMAVVMVNLLNLNINDYKGVAPFTDVPAWAEPYVSACYANNIVSGASATTYNGDAGVTTAEASLMIQKALGYFQYLSDFGDDWQLATIKQGSKIDLYDGINSSATAALTRNDVAQLVLNALQAKLVYATVSGNNTQIEAGDVSIIVTPVVQYNEYSDGRTLADKLYNGKLVKDEQVDADAFGRPADYAWKLDGKTIYTANAEAVLTYAGTKTASALYNALGLSATKDLTVITDGTPAEKTVSLAKADTTTTVGAVGATTYVYKVDGGYTASVIVNHLGQVTKVTKAVAATDTAAAEAAYVTVSVPGVGESLTYETDAFAKDEYVVVNVAKGAIEAIEVADSVDGVITAYTATTVTVDGTKYTLADNAAVDPADIGFTATYTYFVKDGVVLGAILKQNEEAISTDYVYVNAYQAAASAGDLLSGASNKAVADVIFTDGTHAVIELALTKTDDGYTYTKPAANGTVVTDAALVKADKTPVGNWFAYTVTSTGAYKLAEVNDKYADVATTGVSLTKDKTATIGDKYTTSATKVITIDEDYTLTSTTGLIKADLTGKVLYTYAADSNLISAIYAVGQAAPTTEVTYTYAYAVASGNTVKGGVEWTFAINGKQETYVISSGNVAKGNVYTLTSQDDGTYAVSAPVELSAAAKVTVADTTFFVAGDTYYYASNYAVYNVSDDASVVGETDILAVDDYVEVITNTDGAAVVVYIVNAPVAG